MASRGARARRSSQSLTLALPRAQERVHQDDWSDLALSRSSYALHTDRAVRAVYQDPLRRIQVAPDYRRRARMSGTLLAPLSAKPRVARLSSGRYSALRLLQVRAPMRARFCVRRKQRREVLFAMGRAGFSGSAPGRYFRRAESSYRC